MTAESRAWQMEQGTYIEPGNGAWQTLTMVEERTFRRCRKNIFKIVPIKEIRKICNEKSTALGYLKSLIFM